MNSNNLTEVEMIIRLALGFLAGAILGFERSSRRQVAGLRTHILISLGATLLMLLSIWIPQQYMDTRSGDPGRIAAQVVSGIGFLGAGAIIRLGNNVRGLTTSASLWFVAAVGLAVGAGMYLIAGVAEAAGLITLLMLSNLERRLFPTERYKILEVFYKCNITYTENVMDILRKSRIRIQSVNIVKGSKNRTKLRILTAIPNNIDIALVSQSIKSLEDVAKVEITEKY